MFFMDKKNIQSKMLSYRDAICEATVQEMKRDKNVFVYGIDIADHKGIFGTTAGLAEKFGAKRSFSTPLCEEALVGFGLGSALAGLRPINVHMRIDFLLLAMNQLSNMVSSWHYGSGGQMKVPMVIRAVIGRGWGQSYQHNKSMQSVFAHIPGLKVVMPTTPEDAKGLLITAIRDDNPVLIIEHRWLYDAIDKVPVRQEPMPFGKAHVLRRGKDITVVATSWMNVEALRAAEVLARRGVEVEVVDPRTLVPLDEKTIIRSVQKTKRCIVADYDWGFCGFGAEIAARVSEKCFGVLRGPVGRIHFADTPCPCTRPLEMVFYPGAETIIREIERQLKLTPTDLTKENFYSYERKFKGPF